MPPLLDLTETWAGIYLEVSIAILVFGLGVPAVVLQIIVPEDVRRIVHKRRRLFPWGAYLVGVAAFAALCFIWVLHPCGNGAGGLLLLRDNLRGEVVQHVLTVTAPYENLVANALLTVTIGAALIFWRLQASYRRDRVLGYLERRCGKGIERKGHVEQRALADIRYLGEQGEAGIEKAQALGVLGRLAGRLQGQECYAGAGLEHVVEAIEASLREGGDVENCLQGVAILRQIVVELKKRNLPNAPDMGAALRVLQRVGVLALGLDFELVAVAILDTVSLVGAAPSRVFRPISRMLFELGVVALEAKHFLLAVAILSRLEALARQEQPLTIEKAANYLGLVAHFSGAGPTARNRAELSLAYMRFEPSLRACLLSAKEQHAALARLDTADRLAGILERSDGPLAQL